MAEDGRTAALDGETEALRFRRYRLVDPDGRAHSFEQRLIHVGTGPDNDLVVDDPTVSRNHARLEFDRHGYRLEDLGSKNGTWVGEVRIGRAHLPPTGVRLRFGRSEVRFEVEDETVEVSLSKAERFGGLLGRSSQMREIYALLERIAPSETTVLVEGESGTGKELVADALHQHSQRRDGPFVVLDCSAIAAELIESELFGHVKGAFTGAVANRAGVFEQAHGGTLFLDEIGELPLGLQAKLLRVLESGRFRPVGSGRTRRASVRVVAASNRRLDHEVAEGRFREDLYYRLAVIRVRIPSLRHRPEDIPLLVEHFLEQAGASEARVSWETMQRLQRHQWPGNVRELRNHVERALLLSEGNRLETRHLVDTAGPADEEGVRAAGADAEGRDLLRVDYDLPFKDAKQRLLEAFEEHYWQRQLEAAGGNVSEAARRGGIHRKSLEHLLKKLELRDQVSE